MLQFIFIQARAYICTYLPIIALNNVVNLQGNLSCKHNGYKQTNPNNFMQQQLYIHIAIVYLFMFALVCFQCNISLSSAPARALNFRGNQRAYRVRAGPLVPANLGSRLRTTNSQVNTNSYNGIYNAK